MPRFGTVHPHTRGDNRTGSTSMDGSCGSPPHAWGQSHAVMPVIEGGRFTPTRVGTIVSVRPLGSRRPVHPHTRGDNELLRQIVVAGVGSPPHAWGQWSETNGRYLYPRFTPTRVGTMWSRRGCCRPAAVHPTRVGTIQPGPRGDQAEAVHPHTRGDNVLAAGFVWATFGSPPHAWGQFQGRHGDRLQGRFTPTRVGTMSWTGRMDGARTVHPHTRGDNTLCL